MDILRFFILALLACSSAWAQPFENYRPLRSRGLIPTDFTTASSEKFEVAKGQLPPSNADTTRTKHDFLLESSFLIDQMLVSGKVLFNDTVSNYLNAVLDSVLATEPELRKKIRVYAVRSSIVNSFTTDDGIILVNLGLLAQLENEAQLAFILCHEIAHYTQRHIINAYIQNEELKKGDGSFKRSSFDEKMLARSIYSQDLEKEADRLGLKRFSELKYGTSTLLNVYEVLRYAQLPFDDVPFEKDFFNTGHYRINDSYFLKKVRPIEALENDGQHPSTHPSPTARQQLTSRFLAKQPPSSDVDHLVSASAFSYLRNVCRFELSDLYLRANRPVLCIYNSFLLLRSFPDNAYLKKQIALALYTLSKYKTGGNYGMVHPGFSHIEGESQQVFHLFYRLKPEELNVLATGYLWRLKHEFSESDDLNAMSRDLLNDLMQRFYVPGMFSHTAPDFSLEEPDTITVENKYDRIRQKSKENPRLTMVKYALVDLFEDAEFFTAFDSLEQRYWGPESTREPLPEKDNPQKDELRRWKSHGFSLGADKVVVVSPTYAKLDLRKKQKHRFLRSETAREKLTHRIERAGKLLNLDVEILNQPDLKTTQVERFNDIVFLNEWIDQRFNQLEVSMVNLPHDRIDSIINKYGTDLYSWTGVINYRENKPLMYFYLLYALIPPAIPFAVYYLARPNFDTYYYNITFNLRTGNPVLVNYNNYRRRDARDMINSSVYDSFWQMKHKPRAQK